MPIVCRLSFGSYRWIADEVQTRYMTCSRRIEQLKFCGYWVEHRCGNYAFAPIFAGEAFSHRVRIVCRVVRDRLRGRIVNLIESGQAEIPADHGVGRKAIETG